MSLRINQNIEALNSYRNLSVTQGQMSKSLEKLSSGYRINRAADDAAGLAISEGLRSQVGGLKVAVRNTQDGVSVVQTAEGALTETHSILQRMRDLSVQASNDGGVNADAKTNIQSEMNQLKSELDRIAKTTNFNGTNLLDGSYSANIQVGANSGQTISVAIGSTGHGMDSSGLGVSGVDVTGVGLYKADPTAAAAAGKVTTTSASDTAAAVMTITAQGTDKFDATGTIDAFKNVTGTISFGGKTFDMGSVDYGKAADTDNNGVTTNAEGLAALNKAAKSALGLTTDPFAAGSATTLTFTVTDAVAGYTAAGGKAIKDTGATASTAAQISAATATFAAGSGASTAITKIDDAIKTVSTTRANLGAVQNRFEHTINNLSVAVENLSASESRIRDTDMAQEMMSFTRSQILSQAGTAMLAQANQASQGVLSLLRG